MNQQQSIAASGLPPINDTQVSESTCNSTCGRAEFFASFTRRAPVFLPGTTPVYSNAAFQILSYALENITNRTFESILDEGILQAVNMTSSSLATPSDSSNGVIPTSEKASGWDASFGDEAPAQGLFTTLKDLSKAGNAILASSLLSPAKTRQWFKPVTHTSNLVNSVGIPWEIYSFAIPEINPVVEVFTKLGTTGLYSSYIGFVSDYNAGFAILSADTEAPADLNAYADIVSEYLLPALESTAREQAGNNYAGFYLSTESTLNSNVVIETDELPGLSVTALTYNGTDFLAALARLNGIKPSSFSLRLYPTNARSASKFAFRAIFQDANALVDAGTPTCVSWMGVDVLTYGGVSLDLFVFDLDESGQATQLEIPALLTTLKKIVL